MVFYFFVQDWFVLIFSYVFFFNDTATTEIYTLSYTTLFRSGRPRGALGLGSMPLGSRRPTGMEAALKDRKSTRLNSSHEWKSYAGFCLNKETTLSPRQRVVFHYIGGDDRSGRAHGT